ncbi:hypothetical protein AB434_2707 [Heyndrickxia coagulans]|nr:hypothetical protein AB434_2707 [Heyndrickxia coagulans]KYC89612.1 hypothetical protein B4096_3554 [Heyndrickxia coagulans]
MFKKKRPCHKRAGRDKNQAGDFYDCSCGFYAAQADTQIQESQRKWTNELF